LTPDQRLRHFRPRRYLLLRRRQTVLDAGFLGFDELQQEVNLLFKKSVQSDANVTPDLKHSGDNLTNSS